MTAAFPMIACLGAGRMGRGIAVAFAYAGHSVVMIDVKPRSDEQFDQLRADALEEVRKTVASLTRFGLLGEADADVVTSRVTVVAADASSSTLASAETRQAGYGFSD